VGRELPQAGNLLLEELLHNSLHLLLLLKQPLHLLRHQQQLHLQLL
jgi:hypothetical protein